ncbi:peptidase M16 family protein [Bacillus chungangensis]|uniref:Zn-dependent peptidase n=1 Tax=Bacillus chungangensis TaxID=587633 RepID=A0ABT9WX24_9BACI|nr:hypothetical protein [Bacillus chungangensis]MDQ0177300.1 putative Zn-dependent peptidase [Bacillus chungangensis]
MQKLDKLLNLKITIDGNNTVKVFENCNLNSQFVSISLPIGGLSFINQRGERIPSGVAHLIEHLLLDDMNNLFEKYMIKGAKVNGYTHLNTTTFNIIMSDFNASIIDEFLDDLFNKKITNESFSKQKKIVLNEFHTTNTVGSKYERGLRKLFGPIYPYFTVIGNEDDIKGIELYELLSFKEEYFIIENIDFITCGPARSSNVFKWAEKLNKRKDKGLFVPKDISFNEDDIRFIREDNTLFSLLDNDSIEHLITTETIINIIGTVLIEKGIISNYQIDIIGSKLLCILDFKKLPHNGLTISYKEFKQIKIRIVYSFLMSFNYTERFVDRVHWIYLNNYNLSEYYQALNTISYNALLEYLKRLQSIVEQEMG